jgi:hypothetical protein
LKTLELQNTKTKNPQNPPKQSTSPFHTRINKLKTPKMIRRKLKTLELQNTKTRNPRNSQEQNTTPTFTPKNKIK